MINVLFLIQHPILPSCRYRVLQFLPYIEAEGIKSDVEAIPKGSMARRALFDRFADYDVIFLQKKSFYPWTMRGFRRKAKAIIYDIDDAVMLNDPNRAHFRSWKKEWRFAATARWADVVLVVNEYLARLSRPYAKDIRVLPTVVDLSRYVAPDDLRRDGDKVTIGWIGSRTTLTYLDVLRPALEEVGRRYKNVQLKMICNRFFDLKHMPVVKTQWSEETEVRNLFSIDVALSPAIDDPWFRGKGNLKIVQYLASRRAVVCSPVGSLGEVVADGETGLCARSPGEWIHQIGRLIEAPSLRARLGEAGRKRIEEGYCVKAILPAFVKAIKDAASG